MSIYLANDPTGAVFGSVAPTINVNAGGSGYSAANLSTLTVTLSAPPTGGTQATATVLASQINANHQITGITLTNPGSGYLVAPTVTIAGGGGSGATASTSLVPTTVNAVNGVATFNNISVIASVPVDVATPITNGYTIQATSGLLNTSSAPALNVSPAPATQLAATTEPPGNVPAGTRSAGATASSSRPRMPRAT